MLYNSIDVVTQKNNLLVLLSAKCSCTSYSFARRVVTAGFSMTYQAGRRLASGRDLLSDLWSAYSSTSEQFNYTPSTRIPYKILYFYPTLETLNDWTLSLKSKLGVDSVYLNFAKAFGTFSHVKLLTKRTIYGIRRHLLRWIRAFLSSRSEKR